MKITWSPLAIERVSEIAEYISLDSPTAASVWVNDIFEEVEILQTFPKVGRNIPEIENKKFRELIFGNYRIVYRLNEVDISILSVRHCRQILPTNELTV